MQRLTSIPQMGGSSDSRRDLQETLHPTPPLASSSQRFSYNLPKPEKPIVAANSGSGPATCSASERREEHSALFPMNKLPFAEIGREATRPPLTVLHRGLLHPNRRLKLSPEPPQKTTGRKGRFGRRSVSLLGRVQRPLVAGGEMTRKSEFKVVNKAPG